MANDISGFGPVDQVVYDAILSMDSYSRGYDESVLMLPEQVGRYTFSTDSLNVFSGYRQSDAQFAGFYAASYTAEGGEKIISYRGTDSAADVPFGWSAGAGYNSIGSVDLIKTSIAYAYNKLPLSAVTKQTLDDFVNDLKDTASLATEIYAAVQSSTDAASAATAASNMLYNRINADAVKAMVEGAYEDFRNDLKAQLTDQMKNIARALDLGLETGAITQGVNAFLGSQTVDDILSLIDYDIKQAIEEYITKAPVSTLIDNMATTARDTMQSNLQTAFEAGGEDFDRGAEALRSWTETVANSETGTIASSLADTVKSSKNFIDFVGKALTENEWFKGSAYDRQLSHAALAKEYFEAEGNVKTVGHSLGGGLAAFVSALNGTEATGFDAMPGFLAAAHDKGVNSDFSILAALAYPETFEPPANDILTQLTLSNYSGHHIDGEILEFVRSGDAATFLAVGFGLATAALSWFGKLGPAKWSYNLFDQAFKSAVWTEGLENLNPSTSIDPHATDGILGELIGSVNFHSIAYLVIMKYAETLDDQYWTRYGQEIKDALFDEELAFDSGWDQSKHTQAGHALDTMQKAIAYSAIHGGENEALVFGNTAIRALFDDANELAKAEEDGVLPANIRGSEEAILKAVMQFSAQMARQKVDYRDHQGEGLVGPEEGILVWMNEVGELVDPSSSVVMELDLSPILWGLMGEDGEAPIREIPEVPVLWDYLAQKWTVSTDTAAAMMTELYGEAEIENIVRWGWSTEEEGLDLSLPSRTDDQSDYDPKLARFFSATDLDDQMIAAWDNDIILAGDGDDTVWAGLGADIIALQGGDDWVIDQITYPDETGASPGNGRDIYLGAGFNIDYDNFFAADLLYDLVNFLADAAGQDAVKYTLQVSEDATDLVGTGVILQELEETTLGTLPFIRVKLAATGANGVSEDFLNGIDVIHLTERRDEVVLSVPMRDVPIWIDMGDPGSITDSFGKDDWDRVSYKGAGDVSVINGSSRSNLGNPVIEGGLGSLGLIMSLILEVPPNALAVLQQWTDNDGLRVSNAEFTEFGDGEDLVWNADLDDISGWINGDDFQRYGEIWMGGGDDIAYVEDAEYVFAGEMVGNDDDLDDPLGHSAKAGEDMWLEIHGEDGNDVLIARGGEGARLFGEAGRDFLFSTAYKSQLYGGFVDGGDGETDVFWYHPGVFIMDAEKDDILQMYGVPLTGGSNSLFGFEAYSQKIAWDFFVPFVWYGFSTANQLIVASMIHDITGANEEFPDPEGVLANSMIVENFEFGEFKDTWLGRTDKSSLNMYFRIIGGDELEIPTFLSVWGQIGYYIDKLWALAKGFNWQPVEDPLVLDLDGDGIETSSLHQSGVHFDLDGDDFAQKTGWLSSDDGFLVIDEFNDGRIENVEEMFGSQTETGYEELARHDDNGDGVIDENDAVWDDLQVWRDLDQSGTSTHAELFSLSMLGITSFDLGGAMLDQLTPQQNLLREGGTFTRDDGTIGDTYEVIFDSDLSRTEFNGDNGMADFVPLGADGSAINITGRGLLADLAVNASSDLRVQEAVETAAAAMNVPNLDALRDAIRPVLGAWARSLEQSLELTPILTAEVDGVTTILDSAKWVEDEIGGRFELASGDVLTDAGGAVITDPGLADFAAQGWRVEQMFSPSDRAEAPQLRTERPYLVDVIEDRATVLDWGVWVEDAEGGYWTLQSGAPVLDRDGVVIDRPTLTDVRSQVPATETQAWRAETFGFDPFQVVPTDRVGVYLIDGEVVDYTIWVEDDDGGFHMWARNLDRALELQFKEGRPGGFGLRGYEVDLDTLDEADSTLDSLSLIHI